MQRRLTLAVAASAILAVSACGTGGSAEPAATGSTSTGAGKTITLWLAGGDTPDELRT